MEPKLVEKDKEGNLTVGSERFSLDDVVMVHGELLRVPDIIDMNPNLPQEKAIERAGQLGCDYVFIGGELREPGPIRLTKNYLVVFYKQRQANELPSRA